MTSSVSGSYAGSYYPTISTQTTTRPTLSAADQIADDQAIASQFDQDAVVLLDGAATSGSSAADDLFSNDPGSSTTTTGATTGTVLDYVV
jgi:hypothetical protein